MWLPTPRGIPEQQPEQQGQNRPRQQDDGRGEIFLAGVELWRAGPVQDPAAPHYLQLRGRGERGGGAVEPGLGAVIDQAARTGGRGIIGAQVKQV